MTSKEYRRLSRRELLELLIEESERAEELEHQLKITQEKLSSKELKISEAGSIARAALSLNGVFEAAENACRQYLESTKKMNERQKERIARLKEESVAEAKRIVDEAHERARELETETRRRCDEIRMLAMTKESEEKTGVKTENSVKTDEG